MAKVKRTQEQRRRDTQDAVLDAVIELLLEKGYANLTAVDVALRAGVSRGALNHYFRTKQDLVLAAARRAMAAALEMASAMAAEAEKAEDPIDGFLEQSRRFFLEPTYIAVIEILLGARVDFSLRQDFNALIFETQTKLEKIWSSVFQRCGLPEEIAHPLFVMTHHLMRGMAVNTLWHLESSEVDTTVARWKEVIAGVVRTSGAGASPNWPPKRAGRSKS